MWMDNGLVTGRLAASVRPNRTARPFCIFSLHLAVLSPEFSVSHDTRLLRTLCSRNLQTISNPLIFAKWLLTHVLRVPR